MGQIREGKVLLDNVWLGLARINKFRLGLVTLGLSGYSGVQLRSYRKFPEKLLSYFDHHPKEIQKQIIPHLKALT